jgi:hypothetical protein
MGRLFWKLLARACNDGAWCAFMMACNVGGQFLASFGHHAWWVQVVGLGVILFPVAAMFGANSLNGNKCALPRIRLWLLRRARAVPHSGIHAL